MPFPWQTTPALPTRPWNRPEPAAAPPPAGGRRPWDRDPAQLDPGDNEDSFFTIPNALRITGGIAGGLVGSLGGPVGTAAGGAIGAGGGEYLAELMEVRRRQREKINPLQVGTQAAIGAVPLGEIGNVSTAILKGAGLGMGADVASNLAEGRLPGLKEVGRSAVMGGAFGGGAHVALSPFLRPGTPRPPALETAATGERPIPVPPPAGSPFRSVATPTQTSFEPRPPVFPDPAEMAMAYQPNLPGAVKAGGRRMGGFEQGSNLPALPEGFDELNRILAGEDHPALSRSLDEAPALTRPLLPSDADALHQTPGTERRPWEEPPARARFAFHQPGMEDDGSGGFPMFHIEGGPSHQSTVSAETLREMGIEVPEVPGEGLSRPPGPHPSLSRPLNPSGLDANPPAIQQHPPRDPLGFLQPGDERGYSPVPFDVADEATQRALETTSDFSRPELRNHTLKDLVATQPTVTRSVVQEYLDHGATPPLDTLPPGLVGRMREVPGLPTVVEGPDGRMYLAGGTHKSTAAIGRGETEIQALTYPRTRVPEDSGAPSAAHAAELGSVAPTPEQPGAPQSGSKVSQGGFKLPEKVVPDAEFERIQQTLGLPPTPAALEERRGTDVGPPPGSTNRRAQLASGPVLDEAGRVIAPPQEAHGTRPPGPWDQNAVEGAPQTATPVRTAPEPPSRLRGGPQFVDVDPDKVGVDAKTYQFKGGGDAAGVTDRLAQVESWDPIAGEASPLVTHERANGQEFVVDGHQRLGLAKRLKLAGRTGAPQTLRAIRLSEREGVTVPQARRIGAMLNLQQGTGTATDVAKVLREAPLSSLERARIPKDQTSGTKLRMGEDLAKLGDDAFLRVVNGQVHGNPARNEAYGAIVGRLIPDHAEQVGALQSLAKAAPENAYEAEQFVKAIKADGFERGTQTNLFGTEEVAHSLAEPIAKVMAAARRALTSEKSALGNALRNEARLANKGNVLNRAANQAGVEQAGALDKLLDAYGHTAGPVREELKRVAADVQKGTLSPASAANAVLDALEAERGRLAAQPAVREGVQPNDGPGGRAPAAAAAQEPAPVKAPVTPGSKPPELPQANPAEAETILQQLAKTINVENKPLVDELPPLTLQGEKETKPLSRAEQEAAGQSNIFDAPEESAAGKRKVDRGDYDAPGSQMIPKGIKSDPQPSADLPKELASLDELRARHEVRNPGKATEIAESMKRVGWKGRPVLVVNDGGDRIAWTGTHRLAAAKEAGLSPDAVPRLEVDGAKLKAAGYDVADLTAQGKNARIKALRKAGLEDAAKLLEDERGAKSLREANTNVVRDKKQNPRALGTNPRALARAEELLNDGHVDEAERLMGRQIEAKIKAALKHGTGGSEPGTTLVGGLAPFDTETFRRLVQKHPESAWRAATMAIGAATGWQLDEDHPGRGAIMGALAGAGVSAIPKMVQALTTADIKARVGGVEPVRLARNPKKDIGLAELMGGTPERTIPEQFEKARPAFEKFLKALHDEHARTKEVIPQKRVQALRDRYVTPVIADIRRDAKAFGATAAPENRQPYKAAYINAFANRLSGHRTIGQRVVSALSKGKLPADFVERRLGSAIYYAGTGFGVDTALQNLTQPMLASAHVPFKFLAQAYKDLATNPAAKRLVEGALLPLEKPADAIELTLGDFGRKVKGITSKLPDPQKLLRMTDQKNREITYYASRKFAESKGLDAAAADTWARQVMRKTQTEPGALGSNPFHAGPVAGSLRPFTKYPTVFVEHMVDLAKQAAAGKNLGGVARLGGTMLGAIMLGKAAGIDMEDLLVSGGRPLGMDISHPQRSLERIVTGQATPATRGAFDLMAHLDGSADHDLKDDAAAVAIPRYVRKVGDAISHFQTEGANQNHVTRGPGGKIRDITTPDETLMNLLGLKTTRQTDRREALTNFYDKATNSKDVYETNRRRAYEDLSRAIDTNDHAGATDALKRIGSASAVRQFMRERRMLPEDRFFKSLPPAIRREMSSALEDTKATAPGGH